MNVIDFFCGCGGISEDLRNAGLNIVGGIGFYDKSIKPYQRNSPKERKMHDHLTCHNKINFVIIL